MDFNNAFPNHKRQYISPEACEIILNNQDVICQTSPVDGEMREGDNNW